MTQKRRSIAFTCVLESVSWRIKQSPSVFLSLLSAFFCTLTHSPTSSHTHVHTHTHVTCHFSPLHPFLFCPTHKKNAASILPTHLYHCHQNNSPEYSHCAEEEKKKKDRTTIVHPNTLCISWLKCLQLRKALRCTLVFKAVTVPSLVHCWEHCLKRRIRLFSFRSFYTNLHQALGLNMKCSSPRANRESCRRASSTD